MSGGRAGWAVRRWDPSDEGCSKWGETGGKSWGDYFACCPKGTSAQGPFDSENKWCDSSDHEAGNSTSDPQCASGKWSLYTVDNWWWCCDKSSQDDSGYFYSNTSDWEFGCASSSWINSADPNVRTADSHFSPPDESKETPISKGAIAGAVVGGVCGAIILAGIIWFLFRRRRRSKIARYEDNPAITKNIGWQPQTQYQTIPTELADTRSGPSEVDGHWDRKEAPGDMPSPQEFVGDMPKKQIPQELP